MCRSMLVVSILQVDANLIFKLVNTYKNEWPIY